MLKMAGKRNSLIDYVQDAIIQMVYESEQSGKNIIGDYIFSEGELAQKFAVSRSTIREAVRSLEVRGFVERVQGVGIRLIDHSLEVVSQSLTDMLVRKGADYSELIQVRRIIEVEAAGLAAKNATVEIEALEKAIAVMKDNSVSYEDYTAADFSFHANIIKATKNKTLEALVLAYRYIIEKLILASTSPKERPEKNITYHMEILRCINLHDVKGARKAMMIHLDATEENLDHYSRMQTAAQ